MTQCLQNLELFSAVSPKSVSFVAVIKKMNKIMAENRQELNRNLAQMLKGGVIMDVTTPEQAKIA